MNRLFIFVALVMFSNATSARADDSLFCSHPSYEAKNNYFFTIKKSSSGEYEYTFSDGNSIAPRIDRFGITEPNKKIITLRKENTNSDLCKLSILESNKHKFSIQQSDLARGWRITLPANNSSTDLVCLVSSEFKNKFCSSNEIRAREEVERDIRPICDDVNQAAPLCTGALDSY